MNERCHADFFFTRMVFDPCDASVLLYVISYCKKFKRSTASFATEQLIELIKAAS
jgi:hypothetical protein